jgi:hypothetical protein
MPLQPATTKQSPGRHSGRVHHEISESELSLLRTCAAAMTSAVGAGIFMRSQNGPAKAKLLNSVGKAIEHAH